MSKTLVILRHAHRDKSLGGDADNGLSKKGRKQVKALTRFYKIHYSEERPLIYSSPKQRCIETVAEISQLTRAPVELRADLDEGGDLTKKIRGFIQWWKKDAPEFIVICSHGDWIPLCLKLLTGGFPHNYQTGDFVSINYV